MGYRTYIGSMPKREYNKIKSMSFEQLKDHYPNKEHVSDDDWYKGVYEYGTELYEFGKYDGFEPPKKSLKRFFKNKELMARYDEYDFYIVTKEFLAYVISTYQERIKKYYQVMVAPFSREKERSSEFLKSIESEYHWSSEPFTKYTFDGTKLTGEEQTAIIEMINHVKSMNMEWCGLPPFSLEHGDTITTSWKYEYGIFGLINIYKTFNWKKNVMIYYGY